MIVNTIRRLLRRDRAARELEKIVNDPDPNVELKVNSEGKIQLASGDNLEPKTSGT